MKKLIVALMLVATAAAVQADLPGYIWNVNWSISGAITPEGDDPLASDYTITWSLLNASNNGALLYKMTSANGAIGLTDERDKVLSYDEYLQPIKSTLWGATEETTAQNLYQRIELYKDSELKYYWESPETSEVKPIEFDTTSVPGTATPMKDNSVFIYDTDWKEATSVPEPATLSLLGLGALAMVLRRKLSK